MRDKRRASLLPAVLSLLLVVAASLMIFDAGDGFAYVLLGPAAAVLSLICFGLNRGGVQRSTSAGWAAAFLLVAVGVPTLIWWPFLTRYIHLTDVKALWLAIFAGGMFVLALARSSSRASRMAMVFAAAVGLAVGPWCITDDVMRAVLFAGPLPAAAMVVGLQYRLPCRLGVAADRNRTGRAK